MFFDARNSELVKGLLAVSCGLAVRVSARRDAFESNCGLIGYRLDRMQLLPICPAPDSSLDY
jgi:hypothetical protein